MLWQHHSSLALGVSAHGTALVLAVTMAGLATGSAAMGVLLARRPGWPPLRVFAACEVVVGLCGLALPAAFSGVARLDVWVFRLHPGGAALLQVTGCVLVLGPPALAMGATLPVFRRLAEGGGTSVGRLYGLNTAGAAAGVLAAAFLLIPALGVELTGVVAAVLDLTVAGAAWLLAGPRAAVPADAAPPGEPAVSPRLAAAVAATTGLVTFALEVAWFRSLRAAFQSTTDSFALMLVAVLLALALGARLAVWLPPRRSALAVVLGAGGVMVLAVSPLVERFDAIVLAGSWWTVLLGRLGLSLAVLGPPVLAIGAALPWLLDRQAGPAAVGRVYAVNTAGAVAGALGAAWLLLPTIGAAGTAWLAGATVGGAGVAAARGRLRAVLLAANLLALGGAVAGGSGVGRLRVQGAHLQDAHTVLASHEAPDVTVSVIAHPDGGRELVIDGFQTSGEARTGHYMAWMGRLPVLLHAEPRRALVICFGTGQTAHAVRAEGAARLDLVDVSAEVFAVAPLFPSNRGVLDDPRVTAYVMDGRAWLRRTARRYDVVTLEPMAPHFAGTNALYSREFYELVAARLAPGGTVAQWVPLHILSPEEVASVARAFVEVFPHAGLWVDPVDRTGILLGRDARGPWTWPGLARPAQGRDLTAAAVRAALLLEGPALARFAALGTAVTDDNQLLAYGSGRRRLRDFGSTEAVHALNLEILRRVAAQEGAPAAGPVPAPAPPTPR